MSMSEEEAKGLTKRNKESDHEIAGEPIPGGRKTGDPVHDAAVYDSKVAKEPIGPVRGQKLEPPPGEIFETGDLSLFPASPGSPSADIDCDPVFNSELLHKI